MRKFAILLVAVAITACGAKKELTRLPGDEIPAVPAAAATPPTSDELITADDQARPRRSDEALKRSERREDDRFDLPPG